jgi:hypothetical protein
MEGVSKAVNIGLRHTAYALSNFRMLRYFSLSCFAMCIWRFQQTTLKNLREFKRKVLWTLAATAFAGKFTSVLRKFRI